MTRVVLHIDRLVLKGFERQAREGIAEGLREELTRLLAAPEVARQLQSRHGIPALKVGAIRIQAGAPPAAIGVQAARGIVRGVGS